jgi:hypothetical protein
MVETMEDRACCSAFEGFLGFGPWHRSFGAVECGRSRRH